MATMGIKEGTKVRPKRLFEIRNRNMSPEYIDSMDLFARDNPIAVVFDVDSRGFFRIESLDGVGSRCLWHREWLDSVVCIEKGQRIYPNCRAKISIGNQRYSDAMAEFADACIRGDEICLVKDVYRTGNSVIGEGQKTGFIYEWPMDFFSTEKPSEEEWIFFEKETSHEIKSVGTLVDEDDIVIILPDDEIIFTLATGSSIDAVIRTLKSEGAMKDGDIMYIDGKIVSDTYRILGSETVTIINQEE